MCSGARRCCCCGGGSGGNDGVWRAAELPLPEGDEARVPAENVAVVPNDDGTATVTVPHAADAPRMFYAVEAGD